jgi:F-type H+-transporting ATPase subunit a
MSALKKLALSMSMLATGATAFAAAGAAPSPLDEHFFGLPISNSVFTSAIITLAVIVLVRWMVGTPQVVPTRGQAVFESLLTSLKETFEPIVGKKAMPAAFPVLVCLFVFILINNWAGLLPLVGTMGWEDSHGHFTALLRPPTSDANGTLALALVSFGAWLIIIFKYAGPKMIWHDLFGNKAERDSLNGGMYAFLSVIFFMVGIIEIVSILIRPATLTARLFGNVYGGETLLHETGFIFIFYFLELIVGFVQAFVFTLLSAVYIGLICNHGDDHEHHHAPGPHGKSAEHAHH